ncbi:hypothetical protein JW756_06240 [Candidatus Woesearchaeota archaeon]|nr:hypothetical protein [Candidatus Woesearchaeota archaeon]
MKSAALVESTYRGYTYVHTSIVKIYEYLLVISFIPVFLFEGVLIYAFLNKHDVSLMKSMYTSFFANLASIFSALFLFLVENFMNDMHFSSIFTAVYLVIISFVLTFIAETAIIYLFIKKDVKKDPLNQAAKVSFCVNLASHILLLAFLSFV